MVLNSDLYDVIIIGGGAAGMMAAVTCADRGRRVLILEKNASLGEKIKITGGGRCNITNAEYNIHTFLKNYSKAENFLYSPFSQFGVEETFNFFEKRGLPLVVQARKRAFPHTEKAVDVYKTLNNSLKKGLVTIKTNCTVKKINVENAIVTSVETSLGRFAAKNYILATGGVSHPETGSTGDGFGWLKNLGHAVKKPTPTIVPLAVEEPWVKSLAGVSLSFMKITFYVDGKKAFSKLGKVLFTHFGLSGPLILNSAGEVGDLLESGLVTALIDAYPDTDHGLLDARIVKIFDASKNKNLRTIFKNLVPPGTSSAIASLLPDLNLDTKVHSIAREDRKKLVNLLKALPVTIKGLMGYDRAVVADGGVNLEEIDTKTMQSKKIVNLYVVGDLLNIKRPSGGFSLQLCWTTGFVAGNSV